MKLNANKLDNLRKTDKFLKRHIINFSKKTHKLFKKELIYI